MSPGTGGPERDARTFVVPLLMWTPAVEAAQFRYAPTSARLQPSTWRR